MAFLTSGLFSSLNYWAILVVALASFFIGGLWYSPALLENTWMNANGYTPEQVQDIQSNLGAPGFALTFLVNVVMAFVLAIFSRMADSDSVGDGLLLGAMVWLGFVATFSLAVNLFSTKPVDAWLIDAGYHLFVLLLGAVTFALWR